MAERAFEEDDNKKLDKAKKGDSPTPMLDMFGRNLNDLARKHQLDPVIGREHELEQVTQILNKRKKNNVLIIGESGVGKSCLAEGLAIKIVQKETDRSLWDKKIYELNVAAVVSGTKYRGEFENRMRELTNEIKGNPSVIVFIDEIHNLVGAGAAGGGLDASNILKPALARGEIKCIGATTTADYKKYFEGDSALERRFQEVWLNPPSKEQMLEILSSIKGKYEQFHGVKYGEPLLKTLIDMCDRYVPYRNFPDKAVDVMDEVGAFARLKGTNAPEACKDLELKLKEIMREKEAFSLQQRYEDAATKRNEQRLVQAELDYQYDKWNMDRDRDRLPVEAEDVASVISKHSGIPLNKIARNESEKLRDLEASLNSVVIGQEHVIKKVAQAVKRSKMGIQDPNRPFVMLFLGKTGTGKTFLAKTLAKQLFDLDSAFIRLDMSEYMDKFNVSKLIGSPPGYTGYDDKGFLTEQVKNNPYSLILLDEIEKAHPDVFNIFLQVFDDGVLSDSHGTAINFKNCVIIMTSNIGTKNLADTAVGFGVGKSSDQDDEGKVMKELKKNFRPELINRIDEKIVFRSLKQEEVEKIIILEVNVLAKRLAGKGMTMVLKPTMMKFLVENGFDEEYGARPLKRLITAVIENEVAQQMVEGKLGDGVSFSVGYDFKKQKAVIDVDIKK